MNQLNQLGTKTIYFLKSNKSLLSNNATRCFMATNLKMHFLKTPFLKIATNFQTCRSPNKTKTILQFSEDSSKKEVHI